MFYVDVCCFVEVAPPEYWKQLAEQRRVALEETLKENKRLADKVETLEADNRNLEEMLEDAKTLAEMVNVRVFIFQQEIVNPIRLRFPTLLHRH